MFENIAKFFKRLVKSQSKDSPSKDTAKERLHLVLMQDRANVSADFLELMKQEIIEVIKKYIEVDDSAIDVRLTNEMLDDGTNGAPSLYANIPIKNIKNGIKKDSDKANVNGEKEEKNKPEVEENKEDQGKQKEQTENKENKDENNENNKEEIEPKEKQEAENKDEEKIEEPEESAKLEENDKPKENEETIKPEENNQPIEAKEEEKSNKE